MRVAIAPWLDAELSGVERLKALLVPAIDQVMEPIVNGYSPRLRTAFFLGLPNKRPGLPDNLQSALLKELGEKYKRAFTAIEVFSNGHAAGLFALHAAKERLEQGLYDACVIAGVDSYIEPETLEWLEENDQLHGAGPLNNAWGFIPGEAGAALLLMPESIAKFAGLQMLAAVLGTGTSMEPKRIKTETVCIGEGLTLAFRAALVALPTNTVVSDIYCDMNGEPYRADEFGFTALRTKDHFDAASDFVAPADCWGDVAAAGGLLHVQLACAAARKGYAKGSMSFAWASSEMGDRAAALLACPVGWA